MRRAEGSSITLREIVQALGCSVVSCATQLDRTVTGAYVGDLLSDVVARGGTGMLWITRQVHSTIVAVAVLKELAAILIVHGAVPDAETIAKAEAEGVVMLTTTLSAFETAGAVYQLLRQQHTSR
mgnify:CR=1 FL=1